MTVLPFWRERSFQAYFFSVEKKFGKSLDSQDEKISLSFAYYLVVCCKIIVNFDPHITFLRSQSWVELLTFGLSKLQLFLKIFFHFPISSYWNLFYSNLILFKLFQNHNIFFFFTFLTFVLSFSIVGNTQFFHVAFVILVLTFLLVFLYNI